MTQPKSLILLELNELWLGATGNLLDKARSRGCH